MYDSLSDIGNSPLATDCHHLGPDLPPTPALRFHMTEEEETITGGDPDHSKFLYGSMSRPLGIWFSPEFECSLIAASGSWGVIGTSEPLGMSALSSFQLRPVDRASQAASVHKELRAQEENSGEDDPNPPELSLAGINRDDRDIKSARILTQVPEHPGAHSVIRFKKTVGPTGHSCYRDTAPAQTGTGSLHEGIEKIVRMDKVAPPRFVDELVSRWISGAQDPVAG